MEIIDLQLLGAFFAFLDRYLNVLIDGSTKKIMGEKLLKMSVIITTRIRMKEMIITLVRSYAIYKVNLIISITWFKV